MIGRYFFSRVAGLSDPVLGGLLVKGAIAPGARLLVGPLPDGEFSPVKVVSLHRNKAPCCLVRASQSASLTLAPSTARDPPLPHLRPGMVLVSLGDHPQATLFFQVTVSLLSVRNLYEKRRCKGIYFLRYRQQFLSSTTPQRYIPDSKQPSMSATYDKHA